MTIDCLLINENSSVFLRNQRVTQTRLSFAGSQTLLASENEFSSTGNFNSTETVGDARRLRRLKKQHFLTMKPSITKTIVVMTMLITVFNAYKFMFLMHYFSQTFSKRRHLSHKKYDNTAKFSDQSSSRGGAPPPAPHWLYSGIN